MRYHDAPMPCRSGQQDQIGVFFGSSICMWQDNSLSLEWTAFKIEEVDLFDFGFMTAITCMFAG